MGTSSPDVVYCITETSQFMLLTGSVSVVTAPAEELKGSAGGTRSSSCAEQLDFAAAPLTQRGAS